MTAMLRTHLHVTGHGIVAGFAVDPADPARRFIVDLIVDGLPVAVLRACGFWADDPPLSIGDGCYGFHWSMPDSLLDRAQWLEARVANTDVLIGRVERGPDGLPLLASRQPCGVARWQGGLAIQGWVPKNGTARPPRVTAWIEGQIVAEEACRDWATVSWGGRSEALPAFTLRLPPVFADGRARSVDIIGENGRPLAGSPIRMVAFADPLADLIERDVALESERIRARFADELLPQSVPFAMLADWLDRQSAIGPAELASPSRAALLLAGSGDAAITRASLGATNPPWWGAFTLDGGSTETSFSTAALARCLDEAGARFDLFIVTLSGTRVLPSAVRRLAEAFLRHPEATVVYADVTVADVAGHARPFAWPAFDRERWEEQGYPALFFAVRRAGIERAIASGCETLFDLFEAQMSLAEPVHVPHILAHLPMPPVDDLASDLERTARRRSDGRNAPVFVSKAFPPSLRIVRNGPLATVTAIVAVRDQAEALRETLASLSTGAGASRLEVVLVDNASMDEDTLRVLAHARGRGCRVIREPGFFRLPHLLNQGADQATSELLLFLSCGLALPDETVLDELCGRLGRPDVGAVSPVIVHPSGVVEQAGYVIGPHPGVVAPFQDRVADDAGYSGLLRCAHQRSAASSACLLTKRSVFRSIGGFDAVHFPLHLFDVDYCLKLRAGGQHIIVTPHARVFGTLTAPDPVENLDARTPTREQELSRLRQRWALGSACDPFYSPWLNRDGNLYAGLNWFPQDVGARSSAQGLPDPIAEGF